MIASFIVALALMGLAGANSCDVASCFASVDQYKTFQDFIPRQEEIDEPSFCTNVNESLDCIADAQKNAICPISVSRSLVVSAMRTLCHNQEAEARPFVDVMRSPCARLGNDGKKDFVDFAIACWDSLTSYAPDESRCGLSNQGKVCVLGEVKRRCGPNFALFLNKLWDSLGLNSCLVQRSIFEEMKNGNAKSVFDSFNFELPIPNFGK